MTRRCLTSEDTFSFRVKHLSLYYTFGLYYIYCVDNIKSSRLHARHTVLEFRPEFLRPVSLAHVQRTPNSFDRFIRALSKNLSRLYRILFEISVMQEAVQSDFKRDQFQEYSIDRIIAERERERERESLFFP